MARISIARLTLGSAVLMTLALALGGAATAAPSRSEIAMMTGPDRQAKLEQGAKAEGQVFLYTTLIVDQAVIPIKNAWEKRYPAIKFNFVRLSSAPLVQRMLAETRAGKATADVIIGSVTASLTTAKLLEPFTSPELSAFPKDAMGPGNLWMTYRVSYYGFGYNTKLVSEAEAPKTWEDLLNPKWKGKMIWGTSRDTGGLFTIQHLRQSWGEKKSNEYFDQLAKQNVLKSDASVRTLLDLVIAGEHTISLSTALNHAMLSKKEGAPVWFGSPDPVAARPDGLMVPNNAPHPHAAMLFVDYLLSKEGAKVLIDAGYQTARLDIEPDPAMRPIIPHLNGKTSRVYPAEDMATGQDDLMKIFDKVSP